MILLLIALLVILLLWVVIFYFYSDFTVPIFTKFTYKKVLIIYPHPDDEVLSCAGLIKKLRRTGAVVTLVFLTKGEKGTPKAEINAILKEVRTEEAKRSAAVLGVSRLISKDFGDGELPKKIGEITQYIRELCKEKQPDLVITFDQTGIYGHPDHIVCSEVVTDILSKQFPQTELWYNTLPQKVFKFIQLPEHMAKDQNYKSRRQYPTHRVFVGQDTLSKINSLYAHHSQLHGFKSSTPFKWLPLWLYISGMQFEYFYKVKH